MSGRADYEERREARIDRLSKAADKASERSRQYSAESSRMMDTIPMGQPIITGRGARTQADINYRDRAWNKMGQSVKETEKADYYAGRAEAAENNTAISSDDPAAIEKLREKVARLEAEREKVKEFNKAARKNGTEQAPWYTLPYLGRDIKAAKERIEKLERLDSQPVAEDIHFDGGVIHENVEINRVQIIFDDIPAPEVREQLKRLGFKWARSEQAWQRLRSLPAIRAAKYVLNSK